MLQLIVDNREPIEIISKLKKMEVEVTIKQMDQGDYDPGENVLIERKTGSDYVSSLADGRLFEQAIRLTDAAEQVILILESFKDAFSRPGWEKKQKHVFGSLMYLSLRLGILIFPTSNRFETAQLIERVCSWLQEKKDDPIIFSRGVKKSMSTADRQQFLLQGLPQVGAKTAMTLLEHFQTPFNVFSAINSSSIEYTKSGNPKGIIGPLSEVPGIGPKFLEKTKEIL